MISTTFYSLSNCFSYMKYSINNSLIHPAAAAAKPLQSCPTLCDPIDGSPPGSTTPGILQARTLEWVAIPFSNAWKWKVKVKLLSRVRLLATPWTEAHQAPPSMGFSRQECWSGVPLPSPAIALAVFNYPNWEVQKSIYQFLNCNWLRVSRSLNSWAMWVWPAYRKSCFPG